LSWSVIAALLKGYLAVTEYSIVSICLVSLCKPSHCLVNSLQFDIEYFFVHTYVYQESYPVSIGFLPCHYTPHLAIFLVRSICLGHILPFHPVHGYLVCLIFIGIWRYSSMEGFTYFQEALFYLVSIQVTYIFQSLG
jgi:hypothetical protein